MLDLSRVNVQGSMTVPGWLAGTFYNPIDIKWPGRDEFGGALAAASVDAAAPQTQADSSLKLLGSKELHADLLRLKWLVNAVCLQFSHDDEKYWLVCSKPYDYHHAG